MKKKNIFVTGGLGFIGSNLCELLLKKKFRVIAIDYFGIGSNINNLYKHKNLIIKKININNYKLLKNCYLKYKPIGIFNLAAETHVDRSIDNPKPFIESNILGVFNILEILRKNKFFHKNFKMIHISTDEVYGDIKKKYKSLEIDAYNPSSPYASSKASSDLIIKSYSKTYNLPIIITNCTNNFGPKQFPEKLIPKIILNILENKNIPIYGKGLNEREWIYVEEHCKILFQLFKKGKIGENYNIGSGIVYNNIYIAKKILGIIKKNFNTISKSKIVFIKDRPGHDLRYSLNSNKIKKLLNLKFKNNFDVSITKTIKWYIENKKWIESIKKINYHKRIGLVKK